ncbi:MAG TPA: PQQ-binding-like beta-propeller repeat protein, partial [Candidatus Bathyarchaeia archaeon]
TADAHTPAWIIKSYAYLVAAPNPVGVGQTVAIVMWIDSPLVGATVTNDIRRHDYTLTITKPDGQVDTKHWDVLSDTTSIQYYQYTPDLVGNYTLKFDYPNQTYTWTSTTPGANTAYTNDTYLGATKTISLTVQQEPIPAPVDSYPLPTEYWTRPIEGQNTYWYSLSSNWLGTPYVLGSNPAYGPPGAVQPDGSAPNSAHIMWSKPIQYGGIVGGNHTTIAGEMFYSGLSYNSRYNNPLIMQGTLFYQEPNGNLGGQGGLFGAGLGDYVAVDLRTGQELWRVNTTATGISLVPSFGYLYSFDTPNEHGILPNGMLIASASVTGQGTVWRGYDPRTGVLTPMNITNVPGGTNLAGPAGELLKYSLTNLGTTANPNWYLMEWNSSNVFGKISGTDVGTWYSGTANASLPACYDWNVSVNLRGTGWSIGGAALSAVPLIVYNDKLVAVQGTFGGHPGDYTAVTTTDPANITVIDIKVSSTSGKPSGNLLWTKSFEQAAGNNTRTMAAWDPDAGVFIFAEKESMTHTAYSLNDGSLAWGPVSTPAEDFTNDWNFLALGQDVVAYGKLYFHGYAGILYCFDTKTGDLLWTYGNGGAGNSTLSGFVTPYGRYPIFVSTIADGKVYLTTTEHSPNSPLYKDSLLRCVNATDGTEIWTIMDYGNAMYGGVSPVADGYLTTLDTYDARIYCFGKGPSALTVEAPMAGITQGSSLVIRGTVTDIAAGTKQIEQAARFPNGVPAVSDASQSQWMEYVYMQKPRPTDTTGVPVTLSVVDSNGNYREIGKTTSNADGFFAFNWKPDITGQYTVYASFAGSESYYPSHAVTAFAVDQAAATPGPTENLQTNLATTTDLMMYLAVGVVAIIIAIAIVGLLILRKHP